MTVLQHLGAVAREREWLDMAALSAKYPGMFRTAEAARKYVTRHRDLPHARNGRKLIVDRLVFDRYVAASTDQQVSA